MHYVNPVSLILPLLLFLLFDFLASMAEGVEEEPPIMLPEVSVSEGIIRGYYGEHDASTATKTDTTIEDLP